MGSQYTNYTPRRNLFINGNMDIWQRQIAFAAMADQTYMCDKFKYVVNTSTSVVSATRNTGSPPIPYDLSNYYLELNVDTADATLDPGTYAGIECDIEGFIVNTAYSRRCTLSFLVRAWRAGIYTIAFQNNGLDQSWNTEYVINASNVWQRIQVPVELSETGASWDWKDGIGLRVSFVLAAGSTFRTSNLNQWESANKWGSSNQVNAIGSLNDKFEISQVQLEAGYVATPFAFYNIADETLRCQRYYCHSWDDGLFPGSSNNRGQQETLAGGVGFAPLNVKWPARMRAEPAVTLYDTSGNSGKVTANGAGSINATAGYAGQRGMGFISATDNDMIIGEWIDFQYVSNADY